MTKLHRNLKLVLRYKNRVENFEIDDNEFIIGRSEALRVSASYCSIVSREHLKVEVKDDVVWITDLSSSNGTHYLGQAIKPNVPLRFDGGSLYLGPHDQGLEVSISFIEAIIPVSLAPEPELPQAVMSPHFDEVREKLKVDVAVFESQIKHSEQRIEELLQKEVSCKKAVSELEGVLQQKRLELVDQEQKNSSLKAQLEESEKVLSKNKQDLGTIQADTQKIRVRYESEMDEIRTQKKSLMAECDQLTQEQVKIVSVTKQTNEEKLKIEESLKAIQDQLVKVQANVVESESKCQAAKNEQEALSLKIEETKAECERMLACANEFIANEKEKWEKERASMKNHEVALIEKSKESWNKEHQLMKEKAAHELRLWKTNEQKHIQELLLQDVSSLAHHVATHTLAKVSQNENVSTASLVQLLEEKLKESIVDQAPKNASFNPNLKQLTQKFRVKAAVAVVAAVVLIFAITQGPKFIGNKIEVLKEANQKENEDFMKEMRAQRERMLALQLAPRAEFQKNYVDNILYNSGYLAMKQNEALRKEWVAMLSKFFFEELLLDDRKVVEFIPLETSLIRELSEINAVLNSKNFDVNLVLMRKAEKQKLEKMWLLVGGHSHWNKLRKREAEFYLQHSSQESNIRIPSSSIAE